MLHLNTIDEVMHHTLVSLLNQDYLQSFALAGGTSLALRFGHRKSVDLDFFSLTKFDPVLQNELLKTDYPNTVFSGNNKYMLFCNINGVKTDFVHHPYPLLQPFETINDVRLFSLPDVTAMKLQAITQRGSKKDFYDLWQLLQIMNVKELIEIYSSKYGAEQTWMLITSATYFEDAENQTDPVLFNNKLTWEKAKETIRKAFKNVRP